MNRMPEPIVKYFEAANRHDIEQMAACFAMDAVVLDVGEGTETRGIAAIRDWLAEIHRKYRLQVNPLDVAADGHGVVVNAEVSGTFDGSPLEFRYEFKLKDSLIVFLSSTLNES